MRTTPALPWLLAALSAPLLASPVVAKAQPQYQFDIPAGPLDDALATVSRMSGVSVGSVERLSDIRTRPLKGRMSIEEALDRLTRGTPFLAQRVSVSAFRIVRRPQRVAPPVPARPRAAPPTHRPPLRAAPAKAAPSPEAVLPGIVVTATKRAQASDDVPLDLTVVDPTSFTTGRAAPGTAAIASAQPQLTLAEIGPGQNRLFLRGIADSPFNGPSQSTVAVQLDEARSTYDAPDPSLALVDIQSVEVLAGPQGPLYGTGALGGVVRVITVQPQLDDFDLAAVGSVTGLDRSFALGGSAVVNVPVIPGALGVRLVAYREKQPGWIDSGSRSASNTSVVTGGRLAVRGQLGKWTFDAKVVDQSLDVADTQYTRVEESLTRSAQPPENSRNDFRSASLVAKGLVGRLQATAISSLVRQKIGSRLALSLGAMSSLFADERRFALDSQEVRLAGDRWLSGISILRAQTQRRAVVLGSPTAEPMVTTNQSTTEVAVFGETTLPLAARWSLTTGARVYRTAIDDELLDDAGGKSRRRRKTGLSPSLAVAWKPDGGGIVYARAAHALRPGALGLLANSSAAPVEDDSVIVLEFGARLPLAEDLSMAATASLTEWRDVQSDVLSEGGLVITRNVGRAGIPSLSLSADWRPARWFVAGSLLVQRSRLDRTSADADIDDLRLPVVPDVAMSLRAGLRGQSWQAGMEGRLTGSSRLSFDPKLDREIGELTEAALFASAEVGLWTVDLRVANLFDSRADRLGYGNSFTILSQPQYVPQAPRRVSLSLTYHWRSGD